MLRKLWTRTKSNTLQICSHKIENSFVKKKSQFCFCFWHLVFLVGQTMQRLTKLYVADVIDCFPQSLVDIVFLFLTTRRKFYGTCEEMDNETSHFAFFACLSPLIPYHTKSIHFSNMRIYNRNTYLIFNLPNLKSLNFKSCWLECPANLQPCKSLCAMHLDMFSVGDNQEGIFANAVKHITELSLTCMYTRERIVGKMAEVCSSLSKLTIDKLADAINFDLSTVVELCVLSLNACDSLTVLNFEALSKVQFIACPLSLSFELTSFVEERLTSIGITKDALLVMEDFDWKRLPHVDTIHIFMDELPPIHVLDLLPIVRNVDVTCRNSISQDQFNALASKTSDRLRIFNRRQQLHVDYSKFQGSCLQTYNENAEDFSSLSSSVTCLCLSSFTSFHAGLSDMSETYLDNIIELQMLWCTADDMIALLDYFLPKKLQSLTVTTLRMSSMFCMHVDCQTKEELAEFRVYLSDESKLCFNQDLPSSRTKCCVVC